MHCRLFSPGWLALLLACGSGPAPGAPAKPAARAPVATPAATPGLPRFKIGLQPAEIPAAGAGTADGLEAQRLARLAMIDFNQGDLHAARVAFTQALSLAPENPAILINLSLIDYRQKQYDSAEKRMKTLLRTQPESGLAWLILGMVRFDQDQLEGALAALAQAVLYEPRNAQAHHYLGVTIGRRGWYSGAEEEMRRALEIEPNYAEAHFNLAVFYLQRTPPAVELARRHYRRALELGAEPDGEVEKSLER